jgi:hypothetical protein
MTFAYWIVAGVLALSNLFAGGTKLVRTKEEIQASGMGWAEDFSQRTIRGIGAAEVLGGLGLILPPLTHIAPVLAPIAAIGLVILQILAAITHVRRHEFKVLAANVPLIILGVVVAVLGFMLWV